MIFNCKKIFLFKKSTEKCRIFSFIILISIHFGVFLNSKINLGKIFYKRNRYSEVSALLTIFYCLLNYTILIGFEIKILKHQPSKYTKFDFNFFIKASNYLTNSIFFFLHLNHFTVFFSNYVKKHFLEWNFTIKIYIRKIQLCLYNSLNVAD